jgi:exonuclease SbcD
LHFPDGDEMNVLVAPYANEQLLRTYLGEENREDELRLILSTKWKKLASTYFTKKSINLFAGHFFFMKEGSSADEEPESERSILHVGGAQALFTDELPDGLHYAALGHLHRYQIIDNRRFPVVYSSSPLCYSFSEAGQEKCVVIIEVDASLTLTMRPVSLQSGFGLERVKFESLSDCISWLEAHQNCFVELTFITDEGLDVASRKAIMGAHPRIVHLIPQLRSAREEQSNQVEAADLQADIRTLFQKYYFSQKGLEPNAELMGLFREVLGEGGES